MRNGIRPRAQTFGGIDRDRLTVDLPSFIPVCYRRHRQKTDQHHQHQYTGQNPFFHPVFSFASFFAAAGPSNTLSSAVSAEEKAGSRFFFCSFCRRKAGSRFWHFWELRYKYTTHLLWLQGSDGIFVGFL
ncbi:MAG: hypothetical protein V8S99_00340 [Oscillospiraceae bacterium]